MIAGGLHRRRMLSSGIRSPYNLPTTLYLVRRYPSYWADIRDYGFTHSEIIPYVEARPNDYAIMISRGEIPLSIITSSGYSWINITDLSTKDISNFNIDVILQNTTKAYTIIGGSTGYNALTVESNEVLVWRNNQGKYYNYPNTPYNIALNIVGTQSSMTVNGVSATYTRQSSDGAGGTYRLFDGRYGGGYSSGQKMVGSMSRAFINNSEYKLYPILRNGAAGMYNITTQTFYPNSGTQPFAVEQSWQTI